MIECRYCDAMVRYRHNHVGKGEWAHINGDLVCNAPFPHYGAPDYKGLLIVYDERMGR